ncbi:MAG: hypothetical protein HC922_09570, partial [Leptolyngbyaceae cyanobacterium SM2_3_12]|nr:hypothetical protein [Leptolyngbyaceae cyanobacterium SM2_3_12]
GRYWFARGAGTTNVVWGFFAHDWVTAGLTALISGLGFTIFRQRRQGRLLALVLLPLITALRYTQDGPLIFAVTCLGVLMGWVYQKIPDDLDLPVQDGRLESRTMFRFFRGDRGLVDLDQPLDPSKYGSKPLSWVSYGPGAILSARLCASAGDDPRPCWPLSSLPPPSRWWCDPPPRTKIPAPPPPLEFINPF